MQIQNVTLAQNNYSQKHNPNFTSIKSVKIEGLYKKYPKLAGELVETFKNNPKAMEFCKKYDVDVVFHAAKGQQENMVRSSVYVFFDNIAKGKIRKFFGKLAGNNEDKVELTTYAREYPISCSIEKSTQKLAEHISPESFVNGSLRGGLFDIHLRMADESIQKALNKKLKKVSEKEAKAAAVNAAEAQLKTDTSELQDSINDLIRDGQ